MTHNFSNFEANVWTQNISTISGEKITKTIITKLTKCMTIKFKHQLFHITGHDTQNAIVACPMWNNFELSFYHFKVNKITFTIILFTLTFLNAHKRHRGHSLLIMEQVEIRRAILKGQWNPDNKTETPSCSTTSKLNIITLCWNIRVNLWRLTNQLKCKKIKAHVDNANPIWYYIIVLNPKPW